MNELIWIAVPGGIDIVGSEPVRVLRVLIVPRLQSPLAQAGMEHWPPSSLINATLAVEFNVFDGVQTHVVDVGQPNFQHQAGVWESFFGENTVIQRSVLRRQREPEVLVTSTSTAADKIKSIFADLARTPLRTDRDERPKFEAAVREQLSNWVSNEQAPPLSSSNLPHSEPPDFHQTIAFLREHPAVLRALGLIFEIRLPVINFPAAFATGLVRVCWPGAPSTLPQVLSPRSKYDDRFLPAATSNIDAGMVKLMDIAVGAATKPRWEVITVDVDGAAQRLTEAARVVAAATASPTARDATPPVAGPRGTVLPALRTVGLSLVRRGRQADYARRREIAEANAQRNSPGDAIFDADDLVLGYRIDIKPRGGDWYSLHKRKATYTVERDGERITITPSQSLEEGHLKTHAAIDYGDGNLKADEIVACWRGWSLSVPLPDFEGALNRRGDLLQTLPYNFDWQFAVPSGTLPKLRFAQSYSMRARVADIAGGGLDIRDQAADRYVIDNIYYRRYEPLTAPNLELPGGQTPATWPPGESIDHVVLRTGTDAADLESRVRRILLPPCTALNLAEQHKALDHMTASEIREMLLQALQVRGANGQFVSELLFPDFAAGGVCVFPRHDSGGPNLNQTERAWTDSWPKIPPMEIMLQEKASIGENTLTWETIPPTTDSPENHRLVVRLSKAEELNLELSSYPKGDFFDHFAIFPDLPNSDSMNVATSGRHPMVSPARTMTFTYAVRRPLSDPWGRLLPRRAEAQTFVVLDPDPALLGIDPKSTGKVEIVGTWMDRRHNTPQHIAHAPVMEIVVDRGDTVFRDPIIHEFGDTRHRIVDYTVTAVSRFRNFFSDQSDESFVTTTKVSNISVPSSALPSVPTIVSVLPAMQWEEQIQTTPEFKIMRRRIGGYLRIELSGPWFETGVGEMLAVLVAKDQHPRADIEPYLTRAGEDPVRLTHAPIPYPTATCFQGGSTPREVRLVENGELVIAVPYDPWFDDSDRCFVDVRLSIERDETSPSYCPFVQLALARYQSDSLDALKLSKVIKTEMIQIMPDRTLTVLRSGADVFVSLTGQVPLETGDKRNRYMVTLEQLQSPTPIAGDSVELIAFGLGADGVPAWFAVPGQTHEGIVGSSDYEHLRCPPGSNKLRVRVREFEPIYAPDGSMSDVGDDLTGRTVYSDTVVLPDI